MTELVLEKTGLLPHANPGVMGMEDLRRLRESNVSVGLMLESVSPRLGRPEAAHWKAPGQGTAIFTHTHHRKRRSVIDGLYDGHPDWYR